jgi:hypothetical protein
MIPFLIATSPSSRVEWRHCVGAIGEVTGVICPDCLTLREQRAIRAEEVRVIRRLERGVPRE